MASIRPARYLGLRDLGAIAPGYRADYLLLDDLTSFPPSEVVVGAQAVARVGSYIGSASQESPHPVEAVTLPGLFAPADFRLGNPGQSEHVRANVVALQTKHTTLTKLETADVDLRDGYVDLSTDAGLALIAVIARNGQSRAAGLIRGTGLISGAFASTVAHDSHNLLVIGRDVDSMAAAANAVYRMGGGVAVTRRETVCARLELPYFGLLSDSAVAAVARDLAAVEGCLAEQGVDLARPFLTLSIMSLTVSPFVKFTDRGLVDTETRSLLPTFRVST